MSDELTENEKLALKQYAKGGGWYEYPGHDKSLRKDELLAMLDGDEFVEPDGEDEGAVEEPPTIAKVDHGQKLVTPTAEADPVDVPLVPLSLGSHGRAVVSARTLLANHGHPSSTKPVFDLEMDRHVSEFQSDRGIPSTGEIDAVTWRHLVNG